MSSSSSSSTTPTEGKRIELGTVDKAASTTASSDAAAAATGATVIPDKSSLAKQPDMGEIKAPAADAGQWIKGYDNQTVMLVAGGAILLLVLMKKSGGGAPQTAYIPMPSFR